MNNTSLKDLISGQDFTGESDIEIIKQWFISNDKESEGIELITELSRSKIDKLNQALTNARMWIPNLPDLYKSNNGKLSKENARKLTNITNMFLLNMPLPPQVLEWAKETIPTIPLPKVIFVPVVEWLKSEYGIEFESHNFNNSKE